jgi:hypothetical protein
MTATPAQDVRALLDRLEQAHAAATPGPWLTYHHPDDRSSATVDFTGARSSDGYVAVCWRSSADAAAIVAEHNAIPALVSALRAVADLADEADAKVRRSVPAAGAERLIENGAHTVRVGDLRSVLAAALSPTEVRP